MTRHRAGLCRRRALAALAAAAFGFATPLSFSSGTRASDGSPKAGSYCPLPEPGKAASCLAPAQARYPDFVVGAGRGELDAEVTAGVEADVAAGARTLAAYDALSTLVHAYYALARRAALAPSIDAETRERLERWNALLARAYAESPEDAAWRDALHSAARDLRSHVPPLALRCEDENGREARCESTEGVLRAMDAERDGTGVRGQLAALLARLFGGER